jgi:hypothetical protein
VSLGPIQNPVRGLVDACAMALSALTASHLWSASAHVPAGRTALAVFSATQIGLCLVLSLLLAEAGRAG